MNILFEAKDLENCVTLLGLSHTINEARHECVCPLSIGEVWVFWDSKKPLPFKLQLGIVLQQRPVGMQKFKEHDLSKEQKEHLTNEFLIASLNKLGICSAKSKQYLMCVRLLEKKSPDIRGVCIYQDSRAVPFNNLQEFKVKNYLWCLRKRTLKSHSMVSAQVFKEICHGVLRDSFRINQKPFCLEQAQSSFGLLVAQQQGRNLAVEVMKEFEAWRTDSARRAFGYDMICRELSQLLIQYDSLEQSQECVKVFFEVLGQFSGWAKMASSGEQEIVFDALCFIEPSIRAQINLN